MSINFMLEDLSEIADKIFSYTPHKTLLFYGDMGVGKTTLIKELAKKIGVTDILSSPTYAIVNEYSINSKKLNHFDCYRLQSEEEAMDIGIEEYLESDDWNFIEWPEKINNFLPKEYTSIQIIKNNNGSRTLTVALVN